MINITILFIIFQVTALLFLAIFARSNSTTSTVVSYSSLVSNCLMFLLAFTLMYAPFRKFSLFSLGSLLINITITVQTHFLFTTFWDSCFDGFNSTFTVDATLITRSLHASLFVLLTSLDFLGLFCYWQAHLILAPIMTIGATLSSAILIKGLHIFDGGSGLLVFFYSGVFSLMIWIVLFRDKFQVDDLNIKKSYFNQILGMLGVILAFINWPKFNAAGALVSLGNVDTNSISIVNLQNSAVSNTFFGLSISLLIAFVFAQQNNQNKMKFSNFVDCFVNGGISIASFQDVALNPSSCLIIAALSSGLTLVIDKKVLQGSNKQEEGMAIKMMKSHGRIIYRILFPFLGIIICSIVVGTRSGQTPNLINNTYSKIAGLEIVGFLLVLVFAAIFGLLAAFLIKIFLGSKDSSQKPAQGQANQKPEWIETDRNPQEVSKQLKKLKLQIEDSNYFLDLDDQIYPLYYDTYGNVKRVQKDVKIALKQGSEIKDALLKNEVNPHQAQKIKQKVKKTQTTNEPKLIISSNFTKNNTQNDRAQIDVSSMKFQKNEMAEEQVNNKNEEEQEDKIQDEEDEIPEMMMETIQPNPVQKQKELEKKRISVIKEVKSEESEIKDQELGKSGMISLRNNLLVTKSNEKPLTTSHSKPLQNDIRGSNIDIRVSRPPDQS